MVVVQRRSRFAALLGVFALLGSGSTAGADPDRTARSSASEDAIRYRVRMEVTVQDTTDDEGLNTEDELYYRVSHLMYLDDEVSDGNQLHRPDGPRELWEMGRSSGERLDRTLFEGTLGRDEFAVLFVSIAEQDNEAPRSSRALTKQAVQAALWSTSPNMGNTGMEQSRQSAVLRDVAAAVTSDLDQIAQAGDDVLGVFSLELGTKGMKATVPKHSGAKVLRRRGDEVEVELSRAGGVYRVRFLRETARRPRPLSYEHLSLEHDECLESEVRVPTAKGDVVVRKGERKVAWIPKRRFRWFCGRSEAWATMPKGTDVVFVQRASKGRELRWFATHVSRPHPDVETPPGR